MLSIVATSAASMFLLMCVTWPLLWKKRRIAAEASVGSLVVACVFLITDILRSGFTPVSGVLIVVIAVTTLLALRLLKGRQPELFLRQSTRRNAVLIILAGIAMGSLYTFLPHISPWLLLCAGYFLLLCIVGALALQAMWGRRHFSYTLSKDERSHTELPTVTLAIPARNETHALTDCLVAALKSDYPKLEIIVLDDCSYDQTPQLIRSFAHDGVRFIQGGVPEKHWVGKTHAYNRLLQESSGEYIVFIGADTLLEPHTISQLIQYSQHYSLDMLSVLPTYRGQAWWMYALQPLRYFWHVARPFSRDYAPVSSECWCIHRPTVQALGGFRGIKQQLVPEATFAKRLLQAGRYRFLIANTSLRVSYSKKWSSLIETSIRLLYPQTKRRPLVVLLLAMMMSFAALGPIVVVAISSSFLVQAFSWAVIIAALATYGVVLARSQQQLWWVYVWFLPVVLLQEAVLLVVSMLKYEFGEVNWKGRNMCYPVLMQKK